MEEEEKSEEWQCCRNSKLAHVNTLSLAFIICSIVCASMCHRDPPMEAALLASSPLPHPVPKVSQQLTATHCPPPPLYTSPVSLMSFSPQPHPFLPAHTDPPSSVLPIAHQLLVFLYLSCLSPSSFLLLIWLLALLLNVLDNTKPLSSSSLHHVFSLWNPLLIFSCDSFVL